MPQKLPTAKRWAFLWRGIGNSFQLAIIASRNTLIDYDIATAQSWSIDNFDVLLPFWQKRYLAGAVPANGHDCIISRYLYFWKYFQYF